MSPRYVADVFKGSVNVPRKFQVMSIEGPISATSKEGKPYSYKEYVLRDESGNQFPPCKILKELHAGVGEWIVGMVPAGKKYPEWSLSDGIDPSKVPPTPGRSEAPAPQKETDWDAIADSKIVHAFMVEAMKLGKSPQEGKIIAVQWHAEQLDASDMATKNRKAFEAGLPSDDTIKADQAAKAAGLPF